MELLGKLVATARNGASVCHQLLMGEGKTTVISPLLALLLGGTALVIQIVPSQLLAFALSVLRGCFASAGPLRKATWTFAFDRRTEVTPALVAKARVAQILAEVGLGASTDEVWAEASRTVAQGGSSAHGV